jgi:hypothetical protein
MRVPKALRSGVSLVSEGSRDHCHHEFRTLVAAQQGGVLDGKQLLPHLDCHRSAIGADKMTKEGAPEIAIASNADQHFPPATVHLHLCTLSLVVC